MSGLLAPSLFDTPQTPVILSASEWVNGTLFGSLAVSLCVIAVAIVGLLLISGRFAIRQGIYVICGCFILLGAPFFGVGLRSVANVERTEIFTPSLTEPPELPSAGYDPYAGASLRRD